MTETSARIGLIVACLTVVVHVASTTWIGLQARRVWKEERSRETLEQRAHALLDEILDRPNQKAIYVFGEDRLRDRAAFLARDWGAVLVEWNGPAIEVSAAWGSRLASRSGPSGLSP